MLLPPAAPSAGKLHQPQPDSAVQLLHEPRAAHLDWPRAHVPSPTSASSSTSAQTLACMRLALFSISYCRCLPKLSKLQLPVDTADACRRC